DPRRYLVEHLDPLGAKRVRHEAQPRDVPARPSETGYESRFYRIGHPHHHNGYGSGGLLCRLHSRRIDGNDYLHFETQQLFCESGKLLGSSCRVPEFYADIPPFGVAKPVKLIAERLQEAWLYILGKHANPMRGRRLLCCCGKR